MKTPLQLSILLGFVFAQFISLGQTEPAKTNETKKTKSDLRNTSNYSLIGGFAAIPLGDFGKADINSGGYAKTGYGIAFDSKNYLSGGFSFIFHSTYAWIDMDASAMSKDFTDYLDKRTEVKDGQHRPFLSTVGLNYDIPLNKSISLAFNAQAGVLYNSFRPFTMKVYDNTNTEIYSDVVSYDSDFAFAYVFGANINFALVPDVISLQLSADYNAGNLNTYLISQNNDPIKAMEKMQFLNIGAGFIFYSKK